MVNINQQQLQLILFLRRVSRKISESVEQNAHSLIVPSEYQQPHAGCRLILRLESRDNQQRVRCSLVAPLQRGAAAGNGPAAVAGGEDSGAQPPAHGGCGWVDGVVRTDGVGVVVEQELAAALVQRAVERLVLGAATASAAASVYGRGAEDQAEGGACVLVRVELKRLGVVPANWREELKGGMRHERETLQARRHSKHGKRMRATRVVRAYALSGRGIIA